MTVTSQTWPNSTGGTAVVFYDDEAKKIVNILHNLNPGGEALFLGWLARSYDLKPQEATRAFSHFAEVRVIDIAWQDEDSPLDVFDDEYIDLTCKEWAALDKSRGTTMESFLADRFGLENRCLRMPISTFKHRLQIAGERGLIEKGINGRWRPKSDT